MQRRDPRMSRSSHFPVPALLIPSLLLGLAVAGCRAPSPIPEEVSEPEKPSGIFSIVDRAGLSFSVTSSLLRRTLVSTRTPYGYAISTVAEGSPAEAIGLRKGDVLLEWDGRLLESLSDLEGWLSEASPGTEVIVHYSRRDGKTTWLKRSPWVDRDGVLTLR